MTSPDSKKSSGWEGAKPGRLIATLAVGCLLYFVLPRIAPLPDGKLFAGTAGAKAAAAKPGDKGAKPGDKAGKPAEAAKPTAGKPEAAAKPTEAKPAAPAKKPVLSAKELAAQQAEAEAKAKLEAAAKVKADAEAKVKAEADAKTKAEAEKLRQSDWVRGLHLFAIFVATILGIILRPLPMGAVAMIGVGLTAITGTLPVADSCLLYTSDAADE